MRNPRLKENKLLRFFGVAFRGTIKAFDKELYVKLQYKYITHKKLHLDNPETYTEKLQFLRLNVYPKDPLVALCAGRATVINYVKSKGYYAEIIENYGVFDKFSDINFDALPNSFVMKCTHASGFNVVVKDKTKIDIKALEKKFNKWLKIDYGNKTVEPHYSLIKHQIIIEKYLIENNEPLPLEYKIHVFNGKAKYLYVVSGRGEDIKYNNYYIDWKPFNDAQFNGWKTSNRNLLPPPNYEKMVEMAEKLAEPFPFVRIDLYNIGGKIYFSEMTFTPAKGTLIFDNEKADSEIGSWLDISKYTNAK